MASDQKRGVCTWCETKGLVFRDTGQCEDCDGNVFYCNVCEEDYHRDNLCRHIFESDYCNFYGAGLDYGPDDCIEKAFIALISAMPPDFAEGLRAAIQSKKFHTWFVAPMIGGGATFTLYGTSGRCGREWEREFGRLGEYGENEALADGYGWLASLYDDKTPRANKITIGWLDKIIDGRDVDLALLRLADDGCPHVYA